MERESRRLRHALAANLERAGLLRSPAIAAAIRAVPRHRFLPGVGAADAYADRALALKLRGDEILSSISQPSMIVQMLELLAPQAGERILEIGTGSGYNAALLAELAGSSGTVTSVEIDPEIAERAAWVLRELGYASVEVRAADGAATLDDRAPFDRIIVTARCDDIAERWWAATREGGRLVIPLRLGWSGESAIGFERRGARFYAIGVKPCAFIALRGLAAEPVEERIFFRDASLASSTAPNRRIIRTIEAVRASDATPQLLEEADAVIARTVTMFALRFD